MGDLFCFRFFGEIPLIALSYPDLQAQCYDPICVAYRECHPEDGEVEVPLHVRETHDCPDHPDHPDHIDPRSGHEVPGSEIRTRTVRAVTDCQLCYLRREQMRELQKSNPELEKRIRRFARAGGRRTLLDRLRQMHARENDAKRRQQMRRLQSKELGAGPSGGAGGGPLSPGAGPHPLAASPRSPAQHGGLVPSPPPLLDLGPTNRKVDALAIDVAARTAQLAQVQQDIRDVKQTMIAVKAVLDLAAAQKLATV